MEFPPLPRRTDRHIRFTAAALITIVLASLIGALAWSRSREGSRALAYTTPQTPPAAAAPSAAPAPSSASPTGPHPESYADTIARVAPAVVTVLAERTSRPSAPAPPLFDDPRLREFFGGDPRGGPGAPRSQGLGSGVIVTADGHLLTNHHVIEGATRLQVELTSRRRFVAQVVGSDPPSDLAVLKIDATSLPAVTFGDSERVRVGDVVLALGNPLGIGQTVTLGIISATDRSTGLGDGSFEDFLQTDAAINSGNSGGALVNARGELVGINSQILTPTGGNIGIGFAIPVNMVRSVMDALRSEGRVRRGRLGVTIQSITDDVARTLELEQLTGALVTTVEPRGPAARAGLEPGDVVVALDGRAVTDANELRNAVAAAGPGREVRLDLLRNRSPRTVTATLDELPGERPRP